MARWTGATATLQRWGGWISGLFSKIDVTTLPWQQSMTFDPVQQLLDAGAAGAAGAAGQPDPDAQTKIWKDSKLAELNFLGLTVSLNTSKRFNHD
jgi:hypothetical protein